MKNLRNISTSVTTLLLLVLFAVGQAFAAPLVNDQVALINGSGCGNCNCSEKKECGCDDCGTNKCTCDKECGGDKKK